MGYVVVKVSEYFGFPVQFSFHQTLNTHLSGVGMIDQLVAVTATPKNYKKIKIYGITSKLKRRV
jgi:hypothetical protein